MKHLLSESQQPAFSSGGIEFCDQTICFSSVCQSSRVSDCGSRNSGFSSCWLGGQSMENFFVLRCLVNCLDLLFQSMGLGLL
jgi:hypothetical protein